jgi:predicted N-acyltransferase
MSSVHELVLRRDAILEDLGYLKCVGLQYQWLNHGYRTFEDYWRISAPSDGIRSRRNAGDG